jgi:hypothetical protein
MIKTIAQFELSSKTRKSYWHVDNDLPIEDAKEMLFHGLKLIGQIEDNVKAQQEAQKAVDQQKSSCEEKDPKVEQIG